MSFVRALIACAGSGGHINPGIAIANTILKKEPDSKIVFIGSKTGMENDLVPKAGFEIKIVHSGRFHRKLTWYNIRNMTYAFIGVFDTMRLIDKFKPDVIIGTGGFICVPVMKAAKLKKIPYVLHESNAFPGLSVRVVAKDAAKVLTGFVDTIKRLPEGTNAVYTGTPAKFNMDTMHILDKKTCIEQLGLKEYAENRKIVFVTGGSQGAIKFNETIINMIKKYKPKDLFFVIAVGALNYDSVKTSIKDIFNIDRYLKVEKFVYDMDKMYKAADLLITRAGAMTVTELSIARRPAILIPLPTAAENHQLFNAKTMENAGAGLIIEENILNEDVLYDTINSVISNDEKLKQMSDNAAKLYMPEVDEKIYNEIKLVIK